MTTRTRQEAEARSLMRSHGLISGPRRTGLKVRIGILSLSVIPDDPRVRRQGDLLARAGWDVVAVGLSGHRSQPPAWRCLEIADDSAGGPPMEQAAHLQRATAFLTALRQATHAPTAPRLTTWLDVCRQAAWLAITDPAAALTAGCSTAMRLARIASWVRAGRVLRFADGRITAGHVERVYWSLNDAYQRLYQTARDERVDLWLANDWPTLPIARKLAEEQGVPFAYDTHELAVDEYAERWAWRLAHRSVIAAIEGAGIEGAAFVSCVSDGIAQRLAAYYELPNTPLVVRNTPPYEPTPFRPTGETIRVLYHGLVSPGRGLEACIESVTLWRPEFALTIRGPASPEYLANLRRIARELSVEHRVTFAPPVPMIDLVRRAAEYDVGLFALPSHSLQNVHVLPNKFFEYLMAGLALCVSDLPEMARILKRHGFGVLIEAMTPEAIAVAVNGLDRTKIDAQKRNALAAARSYSWEVEGQRLLEACGRVARSGYNEEEVSDHTADTPAQARALARLATTNLNPTPEEQQ